MPHFDDPEIAEALTYLVSKGNGFYALTKHADVAEASRHPEIFQSGKGATSMIDLPEEMNEFFGSMINMDNPRHARLRRIVSAAFNPRMIKSIEERIDYVANTVIDRVAAQGGCDFTVEVAARLPLEIICNMMGIGPTDYDTVFNASNIILSNGDSEYVAEGEDPMVAFMNAAQQLNLLMHDLAQYRKEHPTEDVTSALVNTNVDGEALTDAEVASFFILLVVAGNETTRNAISHGLLALTQHPEQRALWQADPGTVAPTAVDEVVRWASPVIWMRRTVAEDTVLGGQEMVAGDRVIMFYNSANRDEDGVRGPVHLRRAALTESPHRVRCGRSSLLPGCAPGPGGDRSDVPAALRAASRHCRNRRARPSAVPVHQRHQTPRLHLHAGGRRTLNLWRRISRWLDDRQRRSALTAIPVAVLKKYGDDRGGSLAALVTFYGFLAVFPLLLLFVTIVGLVLARQSPG